jgi:hypothetical protein
LIGALIESGWIDRHQDGSLWIHDWLDHCPTWVKGVAANKIAREKNVCGTKCGTKYPTKSPTKSDTKSHTKYPTKSATSVATTLPKQKYICPDQRSRACRVRKIQMGKS